MTDGASGTRTANNAVDDVDGAAADASTSARSAAPPNSARSAEVSAKTVDSAGNESTPDFRALTANAADKQQRENFPVALKILPARVRAELTTVYRFARLVDDVGDESNTDRGASLDFIDRDLDRITSGDASIPEVAGIAPLVREYGMPVSLFRDLVDANRMDQRVTRYATFDDLAGYCVLSANPIGRMVLHIARAATPQNEVDSDAVCTGLQVVEHLQDVAEDLARGRIYLPQDDMARFGVTEDDLRAPRASTAVRELVRHECDRAEELIRQGRPLVRRLRGWAKIAVAGYTAGGLAAVAGVRAARYDVLPGPPRGSKARMAREAGLLLLPIRPAARRSPAAGRST